MDARKKNIMFNPTNEQGTILVFSLNAETAGWRIIDIRSAFPDAILEHRGEIWKVEFEHKASNFITHRHDIRECDLIICWDNDYPDCPLPIIELQNEGWVNSNPVKSEQWRKEVEYWKQRALLAERQFNSIKRKIKSDKRADKLDAGEELTSGNSLLNTDRRLNRLVDTIRDNGWSGVQSLARLLNVSRTTIYADLDMLSSRGLLRIIRDDNEKIVDVQPAKISMGIEKILVHANGNGAGKS